MSTEILGYFLETIFVLFLLTNSDLEGTETLDFVPETLDFVPETLFFLVSSRVGEGSGVKNLYENESINNSTNT